MVGAIVRLSDIEKAVAFPNDSDLIVRYWRKVLCGLCPDDCWDWLARMSSDGYGCIWTNRPEHKMLGAHHVSWMIHFGIIPPGLDVLHHCDNPPCSNPRHLFTGTASHNMLDMVAKGRRVYARGAAHWLGGHPELARRGEAVNTAKLTIDDVLAIRAAWPGIGPEHWPFCLAQATQRGVRPQSIDKIVKRINWRHV